MKVSLIAAALRTPHVYVLETQVTKQGSRISYFSQNPITHLMTTSKRVETSRLQHKILNNICILVLINYIRHLDLKLRPVSCIEGCNFHTETLQTNGDKA
jgi:hypothetical protein